MNARRCIETLVSNRDLPDDAEVVSTNNKIVAISRREKLVARIGSTANLNLRDDPHDLRYSHKVAWLAGDTAPVVKPLSSEPIVSGDYVISTYPLLNNEANLDKSSVGEIYTMSRDFGDALTAVETDMVLRRLDVGTYVRERLDSMYDNPRYSQELVGYVSEEVDRMDSQSPFDQLMQNDTALIHGDLKADNIVLDHEGRLKAIDLDAVAVGPRLYDLASWRLRQELGDDAPVGEVVEVGRKTNTWNEDAYRALIGWKAISSMSFTLKYEIPEVYEKKVKDIAKSAAILGGLMPVPFVENS